MASQEILTLQFGELSNFIGAHWWNFQNTSVGPAKFENDDRPIDCGVFFRQGVTTKNESYLNPRLIAVDLKGSLDFPTKTEEFQNDFHEFSNQQGSQFSDANSVLETQSACQWRNLMSNKLHSHSLNLLAGLQHKHSSDMLNLFPVGSKFMRNEENMEFIENQIRFFVEECDYFQGFHVLLDGDNGFGGVASNVLQLVKEEYPNKTTFAIPSFSAHAPDDNFNRAELLTNTGLVMESLFENSDIFSVISLDPEWFSSKSRNFTHLQYKSHLPNHAGAILATALDAVTMPLHTKKTRKQLGLPDFVKHLTSHGRKMVGLSCALPLPIIGSTMVSLNAAYSAVTPLTPCVQDFKDSYAQNLVWRGVSNLSDFQPMVDRWSKRRWDQTSTINCSFSSNCSASKSAYPELFIDPLENITTESSTYFSTFGGLHSSVVLGNSLKQLHTAISKIDVKKLQHFLCSGMEEDEIYENRDRIINYTELYDI